MSRRMKIDEHYRHPLTLRSGEPVYLRLIRPSDKASMKRAFAELSAPSRHKRFFIAKQTLTEEELRYFTEIDSWDHLALGAVALDADGREGDGLGIARFIRLSDDSECAEVALTVIDRMQGQGIGRALLERLIDAATERGIRRFRFECLAHNQEMQHLVRKVCHVVDTRSDGEVMIVETQLPERAPEGLAATDRQRQGYDIYALLRAMAIQSVNLQMSLSRAAMRRSLKSPFSGADLMRRIRHTGLTRRP